MNNAQSNKIHVAFSSGVCAACGRQTRWTLDTKFIINSNSLNTNCALCIAVWNAKPQWLCMREHLYAQNGWYLFLLQFWQTAAILSSKLKTKWNGSKQIHVFSFSVNIYWRRNGFGGRKLQNYYLLCVCAYKRFTFMTIGGRSEAIE